MKCGFYHPEKDCMVDVEDWPDSLEVARATMIQMAVLFQTGRHCMPSPIWCVWDGDDVNSVFLLDNKPRKESFLDRILTLLV